MEAGHKGQLKATEQGSGYRGAPGAGVKRPFHTVILQSLGPFLQLVLSYQPSSLSLVNVPQAPGQMFPLQLGDRAIPITAQGLPPWYTSR